jgi:hypothetical protein
MLAIEENYQTGGGKLECPENYLRISVRFAK